MAEADGQEFFLRQQHPAFPHRNPQWTNFPWGRPNDAALDHGEEATILFVDHDPFQALVYTAALEGRCLEVQRVADAAEALRLAEDRKLASHLDLVISAPYRPGISGPDFVAELHRRLPSVPVLVLGADEDCVQDYPASGALVVFLRKPVTVKKLIETVRQILARGFRNVA